MLNKILAVLGFLRLVNADSQLSLTNLAVMAMIVKVAINPACDLASVAAFVTALGAYHFEKFNRRKTPMANAKPNDILENVIKELRDDVSRLKVANGFIQKNLRDG